MLRHYGVQPKQSLGQSFMISSQAVQRVLEAAELTGDECVLEIGPGLGALTLRLVEAARRVIAVELDSRLLPPLRALLADRVELHHGDILTLPWEQLALDGPYDVVANIPYSITSALLRRLMESPFPAHRLVLTMQREVAERVTAAPGQMSLLAVSVQIYGAPVVTARIPAEAFYPKPKVESAVLRVDLDPHPLVDRRWIEPLFRLARAGFGQRRKQLRNALAAGLAVPTAQATAWLETAGIPPERRAQQLSLEDWLRLAQAAPARN